MRVRANAIAAFIVVVVVVVGVAPTWSVSSADAAPKPNNKRLQKARAELLRRSASRLVREGRFKEGIAELEECYVLAPENKVLLEIAAAYDEWGGHCREALAAFQRFFTACSSCEVAEGGASDHRLVLNRCASDVSFQTFPSGAIVRIEGDDWARVTPFTTRLRPGTYMVDVRRFGHEAQTIAITVEPQTTQSVERDLARTPGVSEKDLQLASPANLSATRELARSLASKSEKIDRGPQETSPWMYVGLGLGLAGGVAGTFFTTQAMASVDAEVEARYAPGEPDLRELESLQDAAVRDSVLAYAGFGVCAAGLAMSVLIHMLDD